MNNYKCFANFYDTLYHERRIKEIENDKKFYLNIARKINGPILEIGVGTLRIALFLAKHGINIWGIDASSAMLRMAKKKLRMCPRIVKKRLKIIKADMLNFDLKRKFPLIIVPSRVFNHVSTFRGQKGVLLNFKKHLRNDGILILDLLPVNTYLKYPKTPKCVERFNHKNNNLIHCFARRTFLNRKRQTFGIELDFKKAINQKNKPIKICSERLKFRWLKHFEAKKLFENCGFHILNFYGDFYKRKYHFGRDQIWLLAKF